MTKATIRTKYSDMYEKLIYKVWNKSGLHRPSVDADYKQTTREQEQPYQQRGKLNDVHDTMVGVDETRCQRVGEDQHEGGVPRMNKTNSVMIRLSRIEPARVCPLFVSKIMKKNGFSPCGAWRVIGQISAIKASVQTVIRSEKER